MRYYSAWTRQRELIFRICATLDRKEWGADVCQAIAEELRAEGYEVRDIEEAAACTPTTF
jgi:hypothetical protein